MTNKKNNNKLLNILILGSSGSGKGTQAELLAKKFNLKLADGGEYLRGIINKNQKGSRKLVKKYHQGNLAPTRIIRDWMKKQIFKKPIAKGLIFSGQPRMIGEARLALKWFKKSGRGIPIVIFLKISKKEAIDRLEKRYICSRCGKSYIFSEKLNKYCKECRGEIVKRDEDRDPAIIKNRLAYFCKQVKKTLKFFKEKGILIEINGEQSPEKVFEDIAKNIEAKR